MDRCRHPFPIEQWSDIRTAVNFRRHDRSNPPTLEEITEALNRVWGSPIHGLPFWPLQGRAGVKITVDAECLQAWYCR
jgi:hypothetical protein